MQLRSSHIQHSQHHLSSSSRSSQVCSKARNVSRKLAVSPRASAAEDLAAQQGGAAATPQHAAATSSRRRVLSSLSAGVMLSIASAAAAAGGFGIDLEKQLPGLPQPAPELPKAYQRTMHKLVKALRDSIESEAAGAKEFEVRRKADGAKDLVKEFVGKWRDNDAVVSDITHTEMKDAISELGRFYQAQGPRARLSGPARDSILAHLSAVEAALPEEEKSLLGF